MPTSATANRRRTEPEPAPQDRSRPAQADPRALALLALQRSAGNAAVARMLAEQRPAPAQRIVQRSWWSKVKGALGGAAKAVGGAVKKAAGAVADVASAAWDGLSDAAKAAWGGIKSAGKFVGKWGMGVLSSMGEWVWDLITEAPERVWHLLQHVGSGIVGSLTWMYDGLKGALGHVWSGLAGTVSWLGEGAAGLFGWVWSGLRRGEAWAKRVLSGDFGALRDGFAGLLGWLGEGAKGLIAWSWEGLQGAAVWAKQGAVGVGRWLLDGFLGGAVWVGRFIAKLLDLAGFGEIVDLLGQIFKFTTRELTSDEITIAGSVFGNTVDYKQVRVDEHSLISTIGAYFKKASGMGVTLFHTINFNKKVNVTAGSADAGWLVHEMTHVWQYEHVGAQYLGEAIHAQATAGYVYGTSESYTDDGNGAVLARRRGEGATFASFNREQQGDIASHYYMRRSNTLPITDWQPYIDDLRAGVG